LFSAEKQGRISLVKRPKTLRFFGTTTLPALLLIVLPLATSFADTFTWVDKNGVVGYADSLQKVPPEYRESAKRVDRSPSSPGSTGKTFQRVPSSPPSSSNAPIINSDQTYASWRERVRAAQAELDQLRSARADAQKEYETFRGELFKRGSAELNAESNLQSRLTDLENQITQKEYELNTTIPDEARRAGVPPGVLSQ
jgi:hypothetical protein